MKYGSQANQDYLMKTKLQPMSPYSATKAATT